MKFRQLMKKSASVFLAAAIAAAGCPAEWLGSTGAARVQAAEENTIYGNLIYGEKDDGTIEITGCKDGTGGELVIPESIGGKRVSSIGWRAFAGCSGLSSVTISEGVTTIGSGAFSGCSSLTGIQLPDSLEVIELYAFEDCGSLEEIDIPSQVRKIGYDNEEGGGIWYASSVFMGCSSLTAIRVAGQNTSYSSEDGVLFDKEKSQLIYYPGGKTGASYKIPDSIEVISYAFRDCVHLETVTVPANVLNIKESAFTGGSVAEICVDEGNPYYFSEDGVLFMESAITGNTICLHTYPSGKRDTSYTVPSKVGTITYCGMNGCKYLTNLTISNGVQFISEYAFGECPNLTHVEISESVHTISNEAFKGCGKLERVVLPSEIGSMGYDIFEGCISLTDVNLPKGITSLRIFTGCTSLEKLAVPEGVTAIGSWEFSSCESLNSIQIPDSVAEIEQDAFDGCAQKGIPLTIYCNEGSAAYQYAKAQGIAVRPYAEYGNPNSQPVSGTTGNGTTGNGTAGNGSGSQNTDTWRKGVKKTISGASYTSLGNGTVAYKAPANKTAKSVTVPATVSLSGKSYSVTQVSANALKNCKKLTKVTIGKNVKQIGAKAFYGCKNLKTITVKSKGLNKVGSKAFKGIHKKAKIKVPKAKLAAYKKLLKGKGQAKSVKITK